MFARFFSFQTYQNGKKLTKFPRIIPNVHKLYRKMAVKYSNGHKTPTFSIPNLPQQGFLV
jgi:hypothetical protein